MQNNQYFDSSNQESIIANNSFIGSVKKALQKLKAKLRNDETSIANDDQDNITSLNMWISRKDSRHAWDNKPLVFYYNISKLHNEQLQAEIKIATYMIDRLKDQKALESINNILCEYVDLDMNDLIEQLTQYATNIGYQDISSFLLTLNTDDICNILHLLKIFSPEALNEAAMIHGVNIQEEILQPTINQQPKVIQTTTQVYNPTQPQIIQKSEDITPDTVIKAFNSSKDLEGFQKFFQIDKDKNSTATLEELFNFLKSINNKDKKLTVELVEKQEPSFFKSLINAIRKLFGCKPLEACTQYNTWKEVTNQQKDVKAKSLVKK